ncbi:MAG: hypothetical protein IMZ53_02405 [Thermoplasmata archaeon]|nr:hypothetical protein [Thermoplasmata archaeon]
MHINWDLVAKIAIPLITLVLGIILNKWFEDRPKLISYISQTFGIYTKAPNGSNLMVHTHSVVVGNVGRKSATDVRLGHSELPAFQILPSIDHSVKDLPDGSKEIVIPTLVPKKQITINYLYFPPLTFNQINTYTESDQGSARIVNMQLTRQYSPRLIKAMLLVFLLGLVTLGYLLIMAIKVVF